MIEIPFRVAGLSEYEQGTLNALVGQWSSKRNHNKLRAGFYDMKNSERALMSSAVPDVVKRRKFVLGWSSIAVDKLNRRCNLDGFYAEDGTDLDSLGLGMLIESNRLLDELSQAGLSSLIHTPSFLVRVRGDVAAGEPPVLILAKDARTATGFWSIRKRALTSFLSIDDFDDSGSPIAMTMFLPNLNVAMTKTAGKWLVARSPHRDGMPVDVLRYKPRLGREFGTSRITPAVMSIHMQALAAMIRADVNGEAYSLPRFVVLGATESAYQNPDGTAKPAWRAAWDAVWMMGDDPDLADDGNDLARADVKQFHGQSPEPQNAHLRMLAQMFSGETGIPIGELGIIGDANPTSEGALTVSRDDIISEAEQTTGVWTPDISRAVTGALRMLSGEGAPIAKPIWRNPQHVSRASAADAGLKTIQALPWMAETEVGLELMGLTQTQIERVLTDRRRLRATETIATLRTAAGGIG